MTQPMHPVREYLNQIAIQSEKDWAFFSSKLQRQEFPKKGKILNVGQTENYLSFVAQGIIRFFIPKEEYDLTFAFAFENEFTSAYDSFLTRSPSIYQVEALTPTWLWRISYTDLQSVYAETEAGNVIGRLAAETLFLNKSKRELALLHETAAQRYLNLFTEKPHLLQQIPLKHLASYIGITPQALSRIRKRIS